MVHGLAGQAQGSDAAQSSSPLFAPRARRATPPSPLGLAFGPTYGFGVSASPLRSSPAFSATSWPFVDAEVPCPAEDTRPCCSGFRCSAADSSVRMRPAAVTSGSADRTRQKCKCVNKRTNAGILLACCLQCAEWGQRLGVTARCRQGKQVLKWSVTH